VALNTTQRFITGVSVYDTYNGMDGSISEMNLNTTATHPLNAFYVGPYFVVTFQDSTVQLFNTNGQRVTNPSGTLLPGVTLITQLEKVALLSAGYPG